MADLIGLVLIALHKESIKIVPKWTKDSAYRVKMHSNFEVGGGKATIDAVYVLTGQMDSSGYTEFIHHQSLKIVSDGKDVSPLINDYRVKFDRNRNVVFVDGGLENSDPLRQFLLGHFFAPVGEIKLNAPVKWRVPANKKLYIRQLSVETTYLGDEVVGSLKLHRFRQTMSEDGQPYWSQGIFWVDSDGRVMKEDVKYKGLPIPVLNDVAFGTYTVDPIE